MIDAHVRKGWGKIQFLFTLSSAAVIIISAESSDIISMMRDLDYEVKDEVWDDVSAALDIIHRNDSGKVRHIDSSLLWIQEIAVSQRLKFRDKYHPVDIYPKYLNRQLNDHQIQKLNYHFACDRVNESSKLHIISQSVDDYMTGNNKSNCI